MVRECSNYPVLFTCMRLSGLDFRAIYVDVEASPERRDLPGYRTAARDVHSERI